MKKNLIIYTLFLTALFFLGISAQGQEQKKPSERSFTSEINKVKQIQDARKASINKMPQPTENTSVDDSKQVAKKEQDQPGNTNTSTQKQQVNPAIKPSTGQMRQPKKPVVSKG